MILTGSYLGTYCHNNGIMLLSTGLISVLNAIYAPGSFRVAVRYPFAIVSVTAVFP